MTLDEIAPDTCLVCAGWEMIVPKRTNERHVAVRFGDIYPDTEIVYTVWVEGRPFDKHTAEFMSGEDGWIVVLSSPLRCPEGIARADEADRLWVAEGIPSPDDTHRWKDILVRGHVHAVQQNYDAIDAVAAGT